MIVRRHQMRIGLTHFNVITKDLIKPDFEGFDAGALALSGLEARHPLLVAFGLANQAIEVGVITGANQATIADRDRGRIHNGLLQQGDDIGLTTASFEQGLQQRGAAIGKQVAHLRQRGQGLPQRHQGPCICRAASDAPDQALGVVYLAQHLTQLRPARHVADQLFDGIEAGADRLALHQRLFNPALQQPFAHRGHRLVERIQ